ncbi:four helix bundle protein [Cupriavidus basilensis]|uniref:Four helix bundle protein n=1 Tax=Cupriavidus basilensis TaxID=68895 RepID=A0ABT6AWU9_9BURK|nr:four helix bundle protein [Cupriavidus basilensis]MDF3837104.1 four helix bundle protein [Cupriavidus basilensis]
MAIHTELAVYKAAMELTILCSRLVAHMPRNHRAVDGARLVAYSRAVVRHIRLANQAADKVPHIEQLLDNLGGLEVEITVCSDLRLISTSGFSKAAPLVGSISRQAGGWKKASASKPDSRPSRRP